MNRQEYKEIVKALTRAQTVYRSKYGPAPEAIQRLDERVKAFVLAQGSNSQLAPKFSLGTKLSFVQFLTRSFVPPQFAYITAVFALIISAAGAGAMSRKALPGESFYSAKIALEQTQIRFVSNPAQRAQRQMEIAGKRLMEAEQVQAPEQKNAAIQRFSQEVKQAQATLEQASDPLQVEAATKSMAEKAREYEEKLLKAKAKAGVERQVGVAAVEEAEEALKDIHNPAL